MARYDAIVVGTGFASSFFLRAWLAAAPANARALVLERGPRTPHDRQIEARHNSPVDHHDTYIPAGDPAKDWWFTVGFGGGSNCWWACTPRMLPSDFQLASRYGVGRDWPVQYDALEPFYAEAEDIMAVSSCPAASPSTSTRSRG
jgi:choline dehydrogenase-like flavoprotein